MLQLFKSLTGGMGGEGGGENDGRREGVKEGGRERMMAGGKEGEREGRRERMRKEGERGREGRRVGGRMRRGEIGREGGKEGWGMQLMFSRTAINSMIASCTSQEAVNTSTTPTAHILGPPSSPYTWPTLIQGCSKHPHST